ncbi:MAG TPA: hypothetical protein VEI54_13390 [Candidatus Limnocylindrales bacterium]|nr:hypothetical protein [Candidatus Limnocylindrales bacterium]
MAEGREGLGVSLVLRVGAGDRFLRQRKLRQLRGRFPAQFLVAETLPTVALGRGIG